MDDSFTHHILVLDDDPDILNFIQHEFSDSGAILVCCDTVDKALKALGEYSFSLGIVDIVMGVNESSERLIQYIKEDFAGDNRDLPLSIISSHIEERSARKFRLKGPNVYATLKKPLKVKSFYEEVIGANRQTIMIVDDDYDMISLFKNELEKGSYQVVTATHTEMAKKVLDFVAIDFLIIDNMLGVGKDSSEFVEYVKKEHFEMPVVLTGKNVKMDIVWADKVNVVGIVAKPIERGELLEIVDQYFDQLDEEQEHRDDPSLYKDEHILEVRQQVQELKDDTMAFHVNGFEESLDSDNIVVSSHEEFDNLSETTLVKGTQEPKESDLIHVSGYADNAIASEKLNSRNKSGQTPIMIYCYLGDMETVKSLIMRGVNLKLKSKNGKNCLHYAAHSGNVELLEYLVEEKGLKINDRDDKNRTPLFDAIKNQDIAMVRACVELGAKLGYKAEGKSYLIYAAQCNFEEAVKYFIALGLSRTDKDYSGLSAMDYALKRKNKNIVDMLRS